MGVKGRLVRAHLRPTGLLGAEDNLPLVLVQAFQDVLE